MSAAAPQTLEPPLPGVSPETRLKYARLHVGQMVTCLNLAYKDVYVAAIIRLFTDQLMDISYHTPDAPTMQPSDEFQREVVAPYLIPVLKEAEVGLTRVCGGCVCVRRVCVQVMLFAWGFVAWKRVLLPDATTYIPAVCTPASHVFSIASEGALVVGLCAQKVGGVGGVVWRTCV